mmetsp:Transcript_42138/g.65955  ORF Transcript_42138/g.65955 Transcript_42138/m.65955 type:complete len:118 (+) Transcript_42138:1004-1357(+)
MNTRYVLSVECAQGFGDITPQTLPGKAVVSGAILVGIGLIPYQISTAVEAILDDGKTEDLVCNRCMTSKHLEDANYCWRCGYRMRAPFRNSLEMGGKERPIGMLEPWSEDSEDNMLS